MTKQCKSRSPQLDVRCEFERGHASVLHQEGFVVWATPGEAAEGMIKAARGADHLVAEAMAEFADEEHAQDRFDVPLESFPGLLHSMAQPDPEQQLTDWWMGAAANEVERTVPKAVEYSSTDLADIGHVLARTAGRMVSDEEAAELGVFFYLQGKMSRWAGAVAQGKRPSDDTIFDIGVYCRMAQRIRHTGSWPGLNLEDK